MCNKRECLVDGVCWCEFPPEQLNDSPALDPFDSTVDLDNAGLPCFGDLPPSLTSQDVKEMNDAYDLMMEELNKTAPPKCIKLTPRFTLRLVEKIELPVGWKVKTKMKLFEWGPPY